MKSIIRLLTLLTLLLSLAASALATGYTQFDAPCQKYQVPKNLALAIAQTESSMYPWAVNIQGKSFKPKTKAEALQLIAYAKARKLSHDIGIMQVNNWWLNKLGIASETALEPANNITLGVYILAMEIKRHGFNWKAVGAYHSPTPWRQQNYASVVSKHYVRN